MARGWESKSVEDQIESADRAKKPSGPVLNAEQLAGIRERESLLSSKTRVERELGEAKNPNHREMLTRALAHLDERLAVLASDR
jgi:hypothetical protein